MLPYCFNVTLSRGQVRINNSIPIDLLGVSDIKLHIVNRVDFATGSFQKYSNVFVSN